MNLSDVLSAQFQRPVVVVVTSEPLAIDDLTSAELHYFAVHVENTPREQSWLRARNALRQVLKVCEDPSDTTQVTFPNARYSITHHGDWALAIGLLSPPFLGIGIDYQAGKPPSDKALRIYLTPEEQANCPDESRLRLWTVKEALFKADANNTQTRFVDYPLTDVSALSGQVGSFRYASVEDLDGWITVAIKD